MFWWEALSSKVSNLLSLARRSLLSPTADPFSFSFSGISGGEKRRLSLAVQLINDPSILVVDEVGLSSLVSFVDDFAVRTLTSSSISQPTSGLDAFIAQNVMQCLSEIAKTGRTVIGEPSFWSALMG